MKRKSNYNARHKKGGRSYKDIPDMKRNPRLRPIGGQVAPDVGHSSAWLFFAALALIALFWTISKL